MQGIKHSLLYNNNENSGNGGIAIHKTKFFYNNDKFCALEFLVVYFISQLFESVPYPWIQDFHLYLVHEDVKSQETNLRPHCTDTSWNHSCFLFVVVVFLYTES